MFDARLQVSAQELLRTTPAHLYSCLDPSWIAMPLTERLTMLEVGGLTEWCVRTHHVLSMGWDWTLDEHEGVLVARWDTLRTNMLLTDSTGELLDAQRTRYCVAQIMEAANWATVTAAAIGIDEWAR